MYGAPPRYFPQRPTPLTLVAIISLLASILTVLGVFLRIFFATLLGMGTWLLGPVVGLVGTVVGAWFILATILQSCLSLLLFSAATATFEGDYRGRSRHQLWAWLTIVLNGLFLLAAGDLPRLGWISLVYALFVLYVMSLPEVIAYFFGVEFGKPRRFDDWSN